MVKPFLPTSGDLASLGCILKKLETYNLPPAYFFVKRIECARANPTANLPYVYLLYGSAGVTCRQTADWSLLQRKLAGVNDGCVCVYMVGSASHMGPYCTNLSTPDDIRRLLELERVMVDRTIKSQTVSLNPNQILTKELSPDMKQWEELIRENVFGLGGHRDHFPACLAHTLYCVVAEEKYNLANFLVKRIQCARYTPTANLPYGMFLTRLYRHVMETYPHLDNGIYDIVDRVMRPLALKQTRRPRSDRGKARHSVSSSSSHHQGTSSHQHDDDDDDNVQTSRASTPSPTTYLNSLDPLNYQNYQMPSASEQTDETLFERQTVLLNQTQQMHKEMRGGFKSFGKALKGVFSKKKK
ncbi:hypothetical protein Tco_1069681 [Tanacetum coccineum]|uniref:Uncharacterized protein n=1 Tax=Tanacetum coccineum TaxID=301880 RepID=A0ABQ5HKD3_9ASTR